MYNEGTCTPLLATNYVFSIMERLNMHPQKLKLLQLLSRLYTSQMERIESASKTFNTKIREYKVSKKEEEDINREGRATLCSILIMNEVDLREYAVKKKKSSKSKRKIHAIEEEEQEEKIEEILEVKKVRVKETLAKITTSSDNQQKENLSEKDVSLTKKVVNKEVTTTPTITTLLPKEKTISSKQTIDIEKEKDKELTIMSKTIIDVNNDSTTPTMINIKPIQNKKDKLNCYYSIDNALEELLQMDKKYFDEDEYISKAHCYVDNNIINQKLFLVLMKHYNCKENDLNKDEIKSLIQQSILQTMKVYYQQRLDDIHYNDTPAKGLCAYMSQYQSYLRMLDDMKKPLNEVKDYYYDENNIEENKLFLKELFKCLDISKEDIEIVFDKQTGNITLFNEMLEHIRGNKKK